MKRMQNKIKMLQEEVARLQKNSQMSAEPTHVVTKGGCTEEVAVSVVTARES
jgi:hypothetical protein